MTPTEYDIAWLAGLWDGEGSVGSHRASPTNVGPKLQMSMTCKVTIDRAIDILRMIGVTAFGYSYVEKKDHHKPAHYIRINRSQDILVVATRLVRYSVTKQDNWISIIEMCQIKLSRRRVMPDGRLARGGTPAAPITSREWELHGRLRALNHRDYA